MKEIFTQKLTSKLISKSIPEPSFTQPLDAMYYETKKRAIFKKRLGFLSSSQNLDFETLKGNLSKTMDILEREPSEIRPYTANGKPGGVVVLNANLPSLIIPDLHGRRQYLINALFDIRFNGISNLNQMQKKHLQWMKKCVNLLL